MSAASEPREPDEQTSGGQNPPSKISRLSSGPDAEETVTMAAPSPLVLGLGLGLCLGPADSAAAAKPPFTFMQMQELEQQALIYKYLAAGLPVPLHLVFPIWKSVAASACAGSLRSPSFLGSGGPLRFDYRNSLEPEPGRCRRTDGKKWRCSRNVVPDQKYCERHMHRGRNRSRKPVEASSGGVPAAAAAFGLQLMPAAHHRNSSKSSSVTSVLRGNAAAAGSCNVGR